MTSSRVGGSPAKPALQLPQRRREDEHQHDLVRESVAELAAALEVDVEQEVSTLLERESHLPRRGPVHVAVDHRVLGELVGRRPSLGNWSAATKWYSTPSVSPGRGWRVV